MSLRAWPTTGDSRRMKEWMTVSWYVVPSKTLAERRPTATSHTLLTYQRPSALHAFNVHSNVPKRWTDISVTIFEGRWIAQDILAELWWSQEPNSGLRGSRTLSIPFIWSARISVGVGVGSGKDLGVHRGLGGCSERLFWEQDLVESRCRGEERDGSLQRSSASPSNFLLRKMARDPRVCFAYSTDPSCLQLSGKSYDNS